MGADKESSAGRKIRTVLFTLKHIRWLHGDMTDMAYFYVYPLFYKLQGKEARSRHARECSCG